MPRRALAGLILISAIVSAAPPCPAQDAAGTWSFTLDGKDIQPTIHSLDGTPGHPQPGDVANIAGFPITLGPPQAYAFLSTPYREGRLLLAAAAGQAPQVVAVRIHRDLVDQKWVVVDPLCALTDDQIRGLRGVDIEDWDPAAVPKLALLDPERAVVVLNDKASVPPAHAFPPLPSGLRYLVLQSGSGSSADEIKDFAPLAGLAALRYLRIYFVRGVAPATLGGLKGLRYLDLCGAHVTDAAPLAGLADLRYLDVSWNDKLADLACVAGMKSLRGLNLENTPVTDLTPLSGLDQLVAVDANLSAVRRLPDADLPALRSLKLMSSPMTEEAVTAFEKAHPQCTVVFHWDRPLRAALAGCTRLRVRSGGTCHRRPEEEKTLFEVTDPARLADVIFNFRIDESRGGIHCQCCGEPSFEFYRGDRLAVTLGFHHGELLRWPEGWPSDGALAPEAATWLVRWLAENGVKGPLAEQEERARLAAARARLLARYAQILPPEVGKAVQAARTQADQLAALEQGAPDAVARAQICLRLFGASLVSWNRSWGADGLAGMTLLKINPADLATAIRNVVGDPAGSVGATRWLLGEGKWKGIDAAALAELLPQLAATGLGDPRVLNRRRTMVALGAIGSEPARAALRRVLAREVSPRALPPEDVQEWSNMIAVTPADRELSELASDAACAALVLARLGDGDSRARIEELAHDAAGEDKKLLDQALGLMKR